MGLLPKLMPTRMRSPFATLPPNALLVVLTAAVEMLFDRVSVVPAYTTTAQANRTTATAANLRIRFMDCFLRKRVISDKDGRLRTFGNFLREEDLDHLATGQWDIRVQYSQNALIVRGTHERMPHVTPILIGCQAPTYWSLVQLRNHKRSFEDPCRGHFFTSIYQNYRNPSPSERPRATNKLRAFASRRFVVHATCVP